MFDALRRAMDRLGKLSTAVVGVAVWEISARVDLPGLNPEVMAEYMRTHGNVMLRLYDLLSGGGLARGALLGLGIAPYLSARIWMWLFRIGTPWMRRMWETRAGRERIREWTRRLTVAIAVVQSIGFTRFSIRPEAGASPIYVLTTMLLLTAGAVFAMLITEQLSPPSDVDLPHEDVETDDVAVPERLPAGAAPAEPIRTARPEGVRTRE